MLRDDAIAIWKAGVAAVDSETLVINHIRHDEQLLIIGDFRIRVDDLQHIEIVGAGKAGAGMARGAEKALASLREEISVSGWVNVPQDCVERLDHVHLHGARPAGLNEPTSDGVRGTEEILRRTGSLSKSALCLVLISGGGSALLPAPVDGISLDDKQQVTRLLASSGATIDQLNCVRSQISRVKAGGLARACTAGNLVALIISDVIGDPLDVIASGPTVCADSSPKDAVDVIRQFDPELSRTPAAIIDYLSQQDSLQSNYSDPACAVNNQVIGNNRTALKAAAEEAERRGYIVVDQGSENCGQAAQAGIKLFETLQQIRNNSSLNPATRYCVLAGGETTVQLAKSNESRSGGRNQELVLAAVGSHPVSNDWQGICLLSGGTDGEDGPTSAAGAVADEELVCNMVEKSIDPDSYLKINNSNPFFDQLDGLLITGPTHTNVMDLQVGLVETRDN